MMNICEILYELSGDDRVYNKDFDLIDNEVLDSFMLIELFYRLEDMGINIYPTRIDKNCLRTPNNIEKLIKENMK